MTCLSHFRKDKKVKCMLHTLAMPPLKMLKISGLYLSYVM